VSNSIGARDVTIKLIFFFSFNNETAILSSRTSDFIVTDERFVLVSILRSSMLRVCHVSSPQILKSPYTSIYRFRE